MPAYFPCCVCNVYSSSPMSPVAPLTTRYQCPHGIRCTHSPTQIQTTFAYQRRLHGVQTTDNVRQSSELPCKMSRFALSVTATHDARVFSFDQAFTWYKQASAYTTNYIAHNRSMERIYAKRKNTINFVIKSYAKSNECVPTSFVWIALHARDCICVFYSLCCVCCVLFTCFSCFYFIFIQSSQWSRGARARAHCQRMLWVSVWHSYTHRRAYIEYLVSSRLRHIQRIAS